MGRYTSNDNRSMQCNPNNERYYSSRGFNDDDDDDDCSDFNQDTWEKEQEKEYKALKKTVDNIAINAFNKKIIFKHLHGNHPIFPNTEMFFEKVLKEKDSLDIVSPVTVKTESFKRFFIDHLEKEKSNKKLRYCSSDFVRDLFETYLSEDVQRNYVCFSRVIFSNSYIVFEITSNQGFTRYNMQKSSYSWSWALESISGMKRRPEVLYENFEDVFKCKNYLFDL